MSDKKKILDDLTKIPEFLEAEQETGTESLKELVATVLQESTVPNDFVTNLLAAEGQLTHVPSNQDLFKKLQDEALNLTGDWNQETVELFLAAYIQQGGSFINQSTENIVASEVFPAAADIDVEGTNAELVELSNEVFAGENGTYPVTNFKLAELAYKQGKVTKQDLLESYGLDQEGKPFFATAGSVKFSYSPETFEASLEALELDETELAEVNAFVESINSPLTLKQGPRPLKLSYERLAALYAKQQEAVGVDNLSLLPALVGILRTKGLSKEDLESASKAYGIFTKTVLLKLLDKVPAKTEVKDPSISNSDAGEEEAKSAAPAPVVVFHDPVTSGNSNDETSSNQINPLFFGFRTKSTKDR